jgi:hypothetical protein
MRSSLVMTLIGAASVAAALLVGCGDNDAKPVSSQNGQSCERTADCASGLSCIANVCYQTAPVIKNTGGEAGQATTTPVVVGPVLGGEGESCTSRRDCETGLACFNQRCTSGTSTGAGGDTGAAPTAQLGDRGETCRTNADCETTLVCVPAGGELSAVGVCDVVNYGIAPTGKTCTGECSTSADCCQLPLLEQGALSVAAEVTIKSCEDIDAEITTLALKCATATTGAAAKLCFAQSAYCSNCTAKTWACTNNACVYNAACTVASLDVPSGCPTFSRVGEPALGCNTTTKKCTGTPSTITPDCTTDANCDDHGTVFDDPGVACTVGECTCYANDGHCYRKCSRNIDCAGSTVCDAKLSVCVPGDACSTDSQCQLGHSIDRKCNNGTCATACTSDRDCSATGEIGASSSFTGSVCGIDGFCAQIPSDQCTTDDECVGVEGGLKMFCVKPVVVAGVTVSSAITDGPAQ